MNIVILAAGRGKRMHSNLPKVLHPLGGRPLLRHVIETARLLNPDRLIVVYGHGGAQVRSAITDQDICWVEQAEQLGTGHALAQTLPYLSPASTTLVLYGDVPLIAENTLRRLLHAAADGMAVLTVNLDNPQGYGRMVRDPRGGICSIVEEKDASPEQRQISEINTGVMVLPTARLAGWLSSLENKNAQAEYYLTDVVQKAVAESVQVSSAQPEAKWEVSGVNDKLQLAELERTLQSNTAHGLMLAGVTLADPTRIDIRGCLSHGKDVSIDIGCIFEGNVELGDGVMIGPYCVLKNVKVEAGARIAAYSHLEGAQVGASAIVGPYARLRPGARLGAETHVGNFVEVKNAVLGAYSKANHLAYIGDAEIGERVNVGAGVITCNYDGANKWKTCIEDDVFVGSDAQLVAPVRIAKGATIGAGTTVTKDVPGGSLVVSRAKQTVVLDWQRPKKN